MGKSPPGETEGETWKLPFPGNFYFEPGKKTFFTYRVRVKSKNPERQVNAINTLTTKYSDMLLNTFFTKTILLVWIVVLQ